MKIKFILILFFLTSIGLSEQSSEEIQNEINSTNTKIEALNNEISNLKNSINSKSL